MSSIALWIGVLIFGLGAIFSLLSAIRTLQISRRWSDYRLRRRYVVQARGSVALALLSGGLAVALLVVGRSAAPPAEPGPLPGTATSTASPTGSAATPDAPIETATAPEAAATATVPTSAPIVPPTLAITATPAMPIAVQALVQGTATPPFAVQFGRLRFSTTINNYTLVAPGEEFTNPIKQMYSVFTYQPIGAKIEWIALWYHNGALEYVDSTSWKDFPAGVGVASWARPAPEWLPGQYEVQIFLGTEWQASGRFVLMGDPPTASPTPQPTSTATAVPTATASGTATITRTPTASLVPTSTRTPSVTPSPTGTRTAKPSPTKPVAPLVAPASTSTRTSIPSPAPTRTPAPPPTNTPPPSATPSLVPSRTLRPTATPIPSNTATRVPTGTAPPTAPPTLTFTPVPVTLDVYFTTTRASGATAPAEEAVRRQIPGTSDTLRAALDQYFAGPTVEEQNRGLVLIRDGFAGYRKAEFRDGVVSVYLAGTCAPSGNGYSLAKPLIATLRQFPGVLYVKLYDAYDHTGNPLSAADSWPACLDVIFTYTPSPSPTFTATVTRTPTALPTGTPRPTATVSPLPTATRTPLPTNTPVPTSSRTALPTSTKTQVPTHTPTAPATATPRATLTAIPTFTSGPTRTPRPTLTLTPINAATQAGQTSAEAPAVAGPTPILDAACDHAEFLGDVTIVDNATLRPGEPFRKTWKIQNAGNCAWTSAYRLVFVRGNQMGGPVSVPLAAPVSPGMSADVSVDLFAPREVGQYEGFWQLRTPGGTTFGLGPAASGNLWVQIRVAGEPVATTSEAATTPGPSTSPTGWAEATLTAFVATQTAEAAPSTATRSAAPPAEAAFAKSACAAQWQANDGILGCPGSDGDPRGLVAILGVARLEDGSTVSAPTLLTVPSDAQDGYILGLYPQFQVQPGDHFRASVGCEIGASLCSVLFRVSYLDTGGAAHDLWTVGEFYDGHYVDIDLDLNELTGQPIRLVLSVSNLGNSEGDRALWVAPRIEQLAVSPGTPVAAPTSTATTRSTPTTLSTAASAPTPTTMPTNTEVPAPPVAAPQAPIPQFLESVLTFFRQLFAGPK